VNISGNGRVDEASFIASPNFDERPAGATVELLVVHAISLPPGEFGGPGIVDLFTNCIDPAAHPYYATLANTMVSAHFLLRRDGELIQFVSCDKRAWHAGVSSWRGRNRCNDFSVGVELEGTDDRPFADAQYIVLSRLSKVLAKHYPIIECLGHSDIAPGRKTDPGPHFDWSRFHALASDE
jgi:AmpD protein